MQKWVCGLLLVAAAASGCGRPLPPGAMVRLAQRPAARNVDESFFARQFYDQLKLQYPGAVTIEGAVVTLRGDAAAAEAGVTTYDFGETALTNQVRVRTVVFDTTIDFNLLMETFASDPGSPEVLPALVVPLAIQLTVAAAQSLAIYALAHRGEEFQRDEAIKSMAVGMATALIPFTAGMRYVGTLTPVAAKILAQSSTLAAADIARASLPLLGEIVLVLRAIWKERKQAL
jgi:hypothetical protein